MIKFFTAPNLIIQELTESAPWDFIPPDNVIESWRRLPKAQRRGRMNLRDTEWQVYTAVRGEIPVRRIAGDNAAAALRGLVIDYDTEVTVENVVAFLQDVRPEFLPNFYERSLSGKARLVWVFEQEILVDGSSYCSKLMETLGDKMRVSTILPGFDKASYKAAEMWTGGGQWYSLKPEPLKFEIIVGAAIDVAGKRAAGRAEVKLEDIAQEVKNRFPGRWEGEFKLDALGVRFWDPSADCVTGTQVKPDGMLCFTGSRPFVKWAEIFGVEWVNAKRANNLGEAAKDIWFDGRTYWVRSGERWLTSAREDVLLRLRTRGVSNRVAKGEPCSDLDRVMEFIQTQQRVDGAAPLISYPDGIMNIDGARVLNIANLQPLAPVKGEFPWTKKFLEGLFDNQTLGSYETFLAWLQRAYRSQLNYEKAMGQAIFLCGPHGNGKTLACMHIIKPLLGDRAANPFDHFTGATTFNAELFHAPLLAINDEEAPDRESTKAKLLARIKAFTVNPSHAYSAKFRDRFMIEWCGRIVVTLNDDPGSVGILPEVNPNTKDKMCFFATKPYTGKWGTRTETETTIRRELPGFAWWLLNEFKPKEDVVVGGRMGIKSFFDPKILELGQQQVYAYNLLELLHVWVKEGLYWQQKNKTWQGSPSELLSVLGMEGCLAALIRDLTINKLSRSLTGLARMASTGISFVPGSERLFVINREEIISRQTNLITPKDQ